MVRIRWRDGMPKRSHYGAVGAFDLAGVSRRQWKDARQPFVRRFFQLQQHRAWFELVSDDVADAAVVSEPNVQAPPDPAPEFATLEVEPGSVVPVEAVGEVPANVQESEPAAPAADDAEDKAGGDEDRVERKRRRGRPPKVRKESAERDW